MTTFYRSVFQVEVLSNEPLPGGMEMSDVLYEITEGECIGDFTDVTLNEKLSRNDALQREIIMGGDGTFLTRMEDDDEEDLEPPPGERDRDRTLTVDDLVNCVPPVKEDPDGD